MRPRLLNVLTRNPRRKFHGVVASWLMVGKVARVAKVRRKTSSTRQVPPCQVLTQRVKCVPAVVDCVQSQKRRNHLDVLTRNPRRKSHGVVTSWLMVGKVARVAKVRRKTSSTRQVPHCQVITQRVNCAPLVVGFARPSARRPAPTVTSAMRKTCMTVFVQSLDL